MKMEKIKFVLGLLLISGLIVYSVASNLDTFSNPDYLNNKLSASVNEVDINPENSKEDSYNGESYKFEAPADWKVIDGDKIRIQSGNKEIIHFSEDNPYNLPVKRWVARDMTDKIMTGREEVKVGEYYLNEIELESFFNNILSKKEKEQVDALGYLNYNSMQHLYLEDGNNGKQVIQLTSREGKFKEEFYTSLNSKVLVFTYNADYGENIEKYRSAIKDIIKSLE